MTKLSIKDYETYIAPLIVGCGRKDCLHYWSSIKEIADKTKNNPQKQKILTLFGAVSSYSLVPDSPNEPLRAYMMMQGRSPIPADLTKEELDFLQEVLPEIKDNELRARVADTLWVLKHGKPHENAKIAIEAYLLAADTFLEEFWLSTKDKLTRALYIFTNLQLDKKTPLKLNAPKKIFKYIEDSNTPHYLVIDLIEVLHKAKHPHNIKNTKILETIATSHETEKNYHAAQDVWILTADLYKRAKMTDEATRCQINIAEIYVKMADIMEAMDNPPYMKICHYLKSAVAIYNSISSKKERRDEIFARLVKTQPKMTDEMNIASVEVDASKLIEQAIKKVSGYDIFTALHKFALIARPPHYETMKKQMEDREQSSPLLAMAPSQKLNHKGRVISTSSPNSSPESKVHEHIAPLHRKFLSESTLIPALEKIRKEHDVSLFDWKDLLKEHPFIPPERVHVYSHGLFLGLQGDFLSAAHILIPQIENSLRYFLNNHGKQTSKQIMNGSQRENSLNKTLGYKELKEIMHKDLIFDLQGLLIMPEGTNLRNDLMHGLLDDNQLFSSDVIYLYWLTLHIIFMPIKVVSKENPDEPPPIT